MGRFPKFHRVGVAIAAIALTVLTATPAFAVVEMPAPAAGVLAGGAIIGAIVVARLWRRK